MQITITRRTATLATAAVVALGALTACNGGDTADQKQKRANFNAAEQTVPFPAGLVAKHPLERANVAEKLKRDSDPNRLSYVYLLSMDGKVISHFVAKGKVSSADSQMLPTQEVRDVCGSGCTDRFQFEAAGDDATYGAREPGIFFFTPEGQMVTWNGDYIQSDRPLSIKTPISLVASAGQPVKKTETRVRVYEDGKLTSETTTTVVEKPAAKPDVAVGFQLPDAARAPEEA